MNLAAIAPHRGFFRRHPIVRDALLWCLPAFVAGTLLRTALISYLPYAFWGADSRSYFSFAHRLIADHAISLNEKRRYLYPLLLTPVAILPGPVLRWLAVFQHALGIASLWPLAYLIRKTMRHWKLWIVPATLIYSALPVIVWYEHELLGETVFFAARLWSFAGWVAWVDEPNLARSRRLFWCFLVPLAAFVLTKPSGRFAWPGVFCGLLLVGAWRRLGWRQGTALGAVFAASLTASSKKQGAWLLYTAAFPLTQLETPAHADYKREIRDLVEPLRDSADVYYLQDNVPFEFLQNPARHDCGPLWRALPNDSKQKTSLYMDLALEGIKARPGMFACFGLQRLIASANLSAFRLDRFTGAYFRTRTEHFYAEGGRDPRNRVRMAFGFSPRDQLPPYAEFQDRLDPHPHSWTARHFQAFMGAVGRSLDFVKMPGGPTSERRLTRARPTALGWWLLIGAALSWLPAYRRTIGVWTVIAASYLFGVFIVSQVNPRYFAPAWVVIVPLLAVPADVLFHRLKHWRAVHPGQSDRSHSARQ